MSLTELSLAVAAGALITWTVLRVGMPALWQDVKHSFQWVASKFAKTPAPAPVVVTPAA